MSSGKWRPFCLGLNVLMAICTAVKAAAGHTCIGNTGHSHWALHRKHHQEDSLSNDIYHDVSRNILILFCGTSWTLTQSGDVWCVGVCTIGVLVTLRLILRVLVWLSFIWGFVILLHSIIAYQHSLSGNSCTTQLVDIICWTAHNIFCTQLSGGGWSYIFRTLNSIPFFPDKCRYHRIFTLSGLFRTCQAPDSAAEVDPIAHFGHFRSHLATCTW